jgi:hypothetical protein
VDSRKDDRGSTSRQNRHVYEHVRDNGNWICAERLVKKAPSRIRGSLIQARASRDSELVRKLRELNESAAE